jgi:hypothetical protein
LAHPPLRKLKKLAASDQLGVGLAAAPNGIDVMAIWGLKTVLVCAI